MYGSTCSEPYDNFPSVNVVHVILDKMTLTVTVECACPSFSAFEQHFRYDRLNIGALQEIVDKLYRKGSSGNLTLRSNQPRHSSILPPQSAVRDKESVVGGEGSRIPQRIA